MTVQKNTTHRQQIREKDKSKASEKTHREHKGEVRKHRNPFIAFLKFIRNTYLTIAGVFLALVVLFGAVFYHFENFYNDCRAKEYDILASATDNSFKQVGETIIYDSDNKKITTLHSTGYKYVQINDISKEIQETYISSEDKDFKQHIGVSPKGMARAAYLYIKTKGKTKQGGSTITQQLVKNTFLSRNKTMSRKLTEIFLALDLEKKYSKAQIMEYYLNTCFYGNNCTGIYAACEYYFGKEPSEINYEEAAMLAGISKSPSVNNPEANMDRAINQRNIVLNELHEDSKITDKQYAEYRSDEYKIREHETKEEKTSYMASFAVYCSALKLMESDGFKFRYTFNDKKQYRTYKKSYSEAYSKAANQIRNGGYKIYTSLDENKQKSLQKSIDDKLIAVSRDKAKDGRYKTQGAAVSIDNATGYVVAAVGGRGINDEYNRAYLSTRQPGSSIKPVIDYTPAFDTGKFYPSRVYDDKEIEKGPKNSNGSSSSGRITIRNAVKISSNTVAYNVLKDIGIKTGLGYMSDLHFSSLSYIDSGSYSISIGGFTNGVKVYEMAGAYAAIENNGRWREPTCIVKIQDTMTGTVYKNENKGKQVYKDSSAYLMTSCLEDVFKEGGTGHGIEVKGQHCAGKTGTTNDYKDGWFCGYTPYYTTAVWVGNDNGSPLYRNFGAQYAGAIWKDYMTKEHKGLKDIDFLKPDSVRKMYVGVYGAPASSGKEQDYFAVKEKTVAVNTANEQIEKDNEAYVESVLSQYEKLSPVNESDFLDADEMYDKINGSIAVITDVDKRNSYLERLNSKKSYLDNAKKQYKNYTMTQTEYEEWKKKQDEKKALEQQQKQDEQNAIQNAVARFDSAIDIIYNTNDETVINSALATAKQNLDVLQGQSDYDTYKSKYDAAEQYVQSKSYEQYEWEP